MIDGVLEQKTQDILRSWNGRIRQSGLSSPKLLFFAFASGLMGGLCAALQLYLPALVLFLLNRFFDSLAKSVQDNTGDNITRSHFDRIVFGVFVFLFTLGANGTSLAAAFLLLSLFVVSAFQKDGDGINRIVGTATMALFVFISCAQPLAYAPVCIIIGFLCWVDGTRQFFNSKKQS